jgi:two-component system, OmpR family, phosphate regulon sensor histidine kinase PhoR
MKDDLWRLLAVMSTSLLIGIFTGQVLLCLFTGLAGYVYWQYRAFKQLLVWLHRGSENEAPEGSGLVDEIAREFDYLRSRHAQRKQKLSGFLKRFQRAVAALPDAIVVLGEHDKIEWANEKALKYIGIRWPQDSEQRISNLVRYPELLSFLEGVSRQTPEKRIEIIAPTDTNLRLEIRVSPYGENQRLLVARNITKLHRINQMRTDFISNASHELRTPLTVVSGYLESFSDDENGSPEIWQDQIKRMRRQTDRMRRLIEDLLKLASLESEQKPNALDSINVPEVIASIRQEAIDLSGAFTHKITVNVDPLLKISGNSNDLRSAFSNLVFNAVKYSPKESEIKIDWFKDKSGAHFSVNDSGEGIAADHISRLTERFYRVDPGRSREQGGTGLGLAIVKHILVRHKAKLEIESIPGKGSTFQCDFPSESIVSELESEPRLVNM